MEGGRAAAAAVGVDNGVDFAIICAYCVDSRGSDYSHLSVCLSIGHSGP